MEAGRHTLRVEPAGKPLEIEVPAIGAATAAPREVTLTVD
jgi:hypothetical protein